MAIFLLIDSDRRNSNPEKDKACYKRGDIVEVFDDDKPCVIPPQPPWIIVKVNGITKQEALKYMEMWREQRMCNDGQDRPLLERRRKYSIRLDDLPTTIKRIVDRDRYIEVTRTQIRNYLRNKLTMEDGF